MRKVAIYARVSTEHEAQLSALDNQVQYYDKKIEEHSDWILYKRYIDEGITGTSIKKRKNFLRMIEDAKNGCFDLIVTREVSRFARNTVDTLQVTRELKKYGVEVFFTEDNIWTFKDDDGELKLTIMATLAQNESKKISQRVKAGQLISFHNGVVYGTGNILGYDRVGKEMVVNEKQAKVVKYIFESFLKGNGVTKIKYDLEQKGIPTAMGKKKWAKSSICRVLSNYFYCGIMEYRKYYVPDYLEQKREKNTRQLNKIYVQGNHEPLISKEDFDLAQKILKEHVVNINKNVNVTKKHGVAAAQYVWSKKLICSCGSSFNRYISHKTDDYVTYQYNCYNQRNHGSYQKRKKLGLDTPDSCGIKPIQEWKLYLMGQFIFDELCVYKNKIITYANEIIDENISNPNSNDEYNSKIEMYEYKIENNNNRLQKLIDLYINDGIDKNEYMSRKQELNNQINDLNKNIFDIKSKMGLTNDELSAKLENLKVIMENCIFNNKDVVSDKLIEKFVKQIIVKEDRFEWELNYLQDIKKTNERLLLATII